MNLASKYRHTEEVATNHKPLSHELLPDRLLQAGGGGDQPLIHLSRHKSPPAQQMNITLLFIDDPTGVNDTLATGEDGQGHACGIYTCIRALIVSISWMSCVSIHLDATSESLQMMVVFTSVWSSPFRSVGMLEYVCVHICQREKGGVLHIQWSSLCLCNMVVLCGGGGGDFPLFRSPFVMPTGLL